MKYRQFELDMPVDNITECLKEEYSNQTILVKKLKFNAQYIIIPCNYDSKTYPLHNCVESLFKEVFFPLILAPLRH